MAAFAILFGTRHLDANEHHEGVVAAIAFESSVKLLALLAVGIFAAFFLAPAVTEAWAANGEVALRRFATLPQDGEARWLTMTLLSMAAVVCLRSEEPPSELQSLMRISYAVFCLKKK